MRHFQKICNFDIEPLKLQLEENPSLWNQQTSRRDRTGSPHTEMSDIWVRYNDIAKAKPDFAGFNDEHVPVWYPAWHKLWALRPIIFGLMTRVQGEMIGGVLITRIPSGQGIAPHVDEGWHVEQYDKFYISVESGPGAEFWCDHEGVKECLNPKPGECYLFDNQKLHWVVNNSGGDRVTAIICIRTEMFGRA